MNYRFTVFFIWCLTGFSQIKQDFIFGEVRNSTDGQSIPDVNVVFKDSTAIFTTVTDVNGKFKLPIITFSKKAKLEISCIGFETKNFNPSTQKVFYLNEKTEVLNAVTISKAKERTSPFFLRHLFDYSINFIPKEKVAMFIPFKESNKNRRIKFLKYQLADVYGVKNLKFLPFKSCLYSVDDFSNKPGQLIFESEIVKKKDNTKWVLVDVSKYDLVVPTSGIFIVFEVLESTHYPQDDILSNQGVIKAAPTLKADFYNQKSNNKCYRKFFFESGEQDWEFIACHFKMEIEYEK